MKKISTVSMLLFFSGLIISGIAVFAAALGLDKNPGGWGRVRVFMFIVGLFLMLCAGIYYRYADQFSPIVRHSLGRFTSWMEANRISASLLRFFRRYGFTFPVAVFVILVYIWFVSSGTWTNWVSPTRYYADLVRGFQRGKLFIPDEPDPRLAELLNPYDPSERAGTDAPIDITYYKGRYYLYWGPVPALILLAIRPIVYGRVGDLQLVFGFVCGIFLAQFFIIIFIWDRFFCRHPKWMLALSIVLAGVAGPVLFMLNNFRGARIYEASISGGQFFLMGGLLFIFIALGRKLPSNWDLFLAGIFFALAIGSRLSLFIPIGVITAISAFWILKSNINLSQKASNLFVLGFPLFFCFVCLGWYNWARFGSITESGLYYQLAGGYIQKNYPDLIKPIYIVQNLYNYLLSPFRIETQFPFAHVEYGNSKAIFSSYRLPSLYNSQQITGLFYIAPFVVFSVIPPLALLFPCFKKATVTSIENDSDTYTYKWIILVLSASFLSAFGFLTLFFWAAMRYIEDFMPSLVILSVIGFWQGYQIFTDKPALKKYFISFGLALAIISIVMSSLIAISINDLRFAFIK